MKTLSNDYIYIENDEPKIRHKRDYIAIGYIPSALMCLYLVYHIVKMIAR